MSRQDAIERLKEARHMKELAESIEPLAQSMAALADDLRAEVMTAKEEIQKTTSEAQRATSKLLEATQVAKTTMEEATAATKTMHLAGDLRIYISAVIYSVFSTIVVLTVYLVWDTKFNAETKRRQKAADMWYHIAENMDSLSPAEQNPIRRLIGWRELEVPQPEPQPTAEQPLPTPKQPAQRKR
jgi:hypothetical protein